MATCERHKKTSLWASHALCLCATESKQICAYMSIPEVFKPFSVQCVVLAPNSCVAGEAWMHIAGMLVKHMQFI